MSDPRPDVFQCRVAAPGLEVLQLMHASFPDHPSRCAAVAADVLSRWQLGGHALTHDLPSFLLVNFGQAETDPVWQLIGCSRGEEPAHSQQNVAMAEMRKLVVKRGKTRPATPESESRILAEWRTARKGIGTARSGGYAALWDNSLGLITGHSDDVVLRLDSAQDHKLFLQDIHRHPGCLTNPQGYDRRMQVVTKTAAVCGSLDSNGWLGMAVTDILTHELPVLFLPHTASVPSPMKQPLGALLTPACFISPWEQQTRHIVPVSRLPQCENREWLQRLEKLIRQRSQFLPGGYQFFLLKTLRELVTVCLKIAAQLPREKISVEEAEQIAVDLLQMTLWSMCAGLEILKWHGWGSEGAREEVARVLEAVRSRDRLTIEEIGRRVPGMDAQAVDRMLAMLSDHGLIRITEGTCSQVALDEYVGFTLSAAQLPPPVLETVALHRRLFPSDP